MFDGPFLLRSSSHGEEHRLLAIGLSSKTHSIGSRRRRSRTDWQYLDRVTDDEIAAAVATDPDAAPLDLDWSDAVLVVPPNKKAISIRVDQDVLDYFKKEGPGYQRRINAVLRSFVERKEHRQKRT
jgi:uncharacterized protein (DUF4415 family)